MFAGGGPSLSVSVHHTGADRAWAYDRESSVGRLDRGLDEAADRGWVVIRTRDDWTTIFP